MGLFDNIKQKQSDAKAKKEATNEERGKELGNVSISYVGGYDDQKRFNAKLCFYENQIEYSQFGQPVKGLVIKASDVGSIEVGGQEQVKSRLSLTRMATLGVFSLAAPKRSSVKDTSVVIVLKDNRQVFFHTKDLTEFDVHSKLANAISYYHAKVGGTTSGQTNPANQGNNLDQLEKLADLKSKGIITQEEFDKKKSELLSS